MDTRLMELRSAPEEGALRGGERQARAAFRLVTRDRTILWLILLEALALTGLSVLFFLVRRETGSVDRHVDRVVEEWVYCVAGSGLATACSLAVACVIDARIDGGGSDLRMAFGEVRRRLPALVGWFLIAMAFLVGLGYGSEAVMDRLPAFLLIAVVWGVGSVFVVPVLAVQSAGPLGSIREALRFLRARWGRVLAGLFVIGFVAGLAFLGCGGLLKAAAKSHPRTTAEPVWRFAAPLLAFYLVYALTAATRSSFGVILARDVLGDLPGEPPTVRPRRRLVIALRRTVFAAAALAVTLVVVGALFITHGSRSGPTTTPGHVAAPAPDQAAAVPITNFAHPFRVPEARQLRPGAPVVLAGKTIGRVDMVHPGRSSRPTEAFYEIEPRYEQLVIHNQMRIAMRRGTAYMVVAIH